jgi:hypothetical protein
MNGVERKWCKRCLVEKPASAFHKHRGRPDGLQHWCKRCLLMQLKALRAAREVAKVKERAEEIGTRVELGKACRQCGQPKPLAEFSVDSRKPDGRCAILASGLAPVRRAAWAKYRARKTLPRGGHVSTDPPPGVEDAP